MEIILASGNRGKLREFKNYLDGEVIPYKEVVSDIEIVENGATFAQNALIKAREIFKMVDRDKYIVISDDSGISVKALNNAPGIYSARYAGEGASDVENLDKLIEELKKRGLDSSSATTQQQLPLLASMESILSTVDVWKSYSSKERDKWLWL